jgi:Ser-tRNA(Ala) deacylase AlaX
MAPGLHESGFIKKSSRLLTADDLKAQTSQKKYTLELDIPETIPEDKLKLYHEAQELRQENIDGKLSFYHEDTAKQKVLLINSHFNGDSVSEVKRTRDGVIGKK